MKSIANLHEVVKEIEAEGTKIERSSQKKNKLIKDLKKENNRLRSVHKHQKDFLIWRSGWRCVTQFYFFRIYNGGILSIKIDMTYTDSYISVDMCTDTKPDSNIVIYSGKILNLIGHEYKQTDLLNSLVCNACEKLMLGIFYNEYFEVMNNEK